MVLRRLGIGRAGLSHRFSARISQNLPSNQRIAAKEIPANLVYEDEHVIAFRDIHPQAPTHILIVPRKPIPRIAEATPADHALIGHLLLKAAEVAAKVGLTNGYRLVINNGPDGGESVPHLHCHILGGRAMGWPPG